MSIVDKIKRDVANSGRSKSSIFYVKEGTKARIRFLQDMEDGKEVVFHDSFADGINVMCRKEIGKKCKYCKNTKLRTRSLYVWSIYNYDLKQVQLFLFAVNNCSPLPALMALYENYGTLTDRDYIISVQGKQQNKTYSVVPMDKNKFKNSKAKAFSEEKTLDILVKAFPEGEHKYGDSKSNDEDPDDEDENDFDDDENNDDDDDDVNESEEVDYTEMSAKELYKLCKERGIKVEPKKSEKFYIKKLEKWDEEHQDDDWGDEDDDEDDWEEDEE